MTRIRVVTPEDADALLRIYAPYVEKTAITFEWRVPGAADFADRIRSIGAFYPWLAAEIGGRIAGYAYASRFRSRKAFDWAVETSIYVDMERRGRGVGRRLYEALEDALVEQGIVICAACIAASDVSDTRLPPGSREFHACLGYRDVGVFHRCGYKFGRWYDIVWMEKSLGPLPPTPASVRPFAGNLLHAAGPAERKGST